MTIRFTSMPTQQLSESISLWMMLVGLFVTIVSFSWPRSPVCIAKHIRNDYENADNVTKLFLDKRCDVVGLLTTMQVVV